MLRPVSWASCSRMCLVGFGVAANAAFSVSSCFAFMVVRGPRRFPPKFWSSFSLLTVSLSDKAAISVSFRTTSSWSWSWESGDKLGSLHAVTAEITIWTLLQIEPLKQLRNYWKVKLITPDYKYHADCQYWVVLSWVWLIKWNNGFYRINIHQFAFSYTFCVKFDGKAQSIHFTNKVSGFYIAESNILLSAKITLQKKKIQQIQGTLNARWRWHDLSNSMRHYKGNYYAFVNDINNGMDCVFVDFPVWLLSNSWSRAQRSHREAEHITFITTLPARTCTDTHELDCGRHHTWEEICVFYTGVA